MSLKLFRSTGYSSILAPGESRVATHPAWLVLGISLWIGFACNVSLWPAVRTALSGEPGLGRAVLASSFIAAVCATVLSLFGWRRTLKRTATVLLLVAALAAASIWIQGLPLDGELLAHGLRTVLFPGWPGLLRWQFPALMAGLGLVPMVWLWQLQVRRLPGPQQLACNATGMFIGLICTAVTGWLLIH